MDASSDSSDVEIIESRPLAPVVQIGKSKKKRPSPSDHPIRKPPQPGPLDRLFLDNARRNVEAQLQHSIAIAPVDDSPQAITEAAQKTDTIAVLLNRPRRQPLIGHKTAKNNKYEPEMKLRIGQQGLQMSSSRKAHSWALMHSEWALQLRETKAFSHQNVQSWMDHLKEYGLNNPGVDIQKLTSWPGKKQGRPTLLPPGIEKEDCGSGAS